MAIGETFLGAVLQVVLDRLASQQVINFFKSSKIDQSLIDELKDLMLVAGKLLTDAEQKQITDAEIKLWLTDLKHLFYRAEEITDQIATEAKRSSMDPSPEPKSFTNKVRNWIPAFSSPSSFASTVSSQISEVVTQLRRKVHLSDALNLRKGYVDVNTASRRETTSYFQHNDQVFGRDQEKEELLKLLFPEQAERNRIDVVAIVGMGGMGKTTLAKFAYNDETLEAFELKAWVYVSDQFDISRVIKSILESITNQTYSGSLELEFLHRELSGKLKEKRFFLVLDDVWNENFEEWESLLAPLTVGAHGSKVIVTTRKATVASIMRAVSMIYLKPLSDADGWSLFSKHAFEVRNLIINPRIEFLGRKIVDKCKGLPLAIKTLGGLLRSKEGIDEWEAILQSTMWDWLDNRANVAPALWLSYHYLPSKLKRCFSYCAIFPKGYRFDRKQLVLLWMAENFVTPSDSGRRIEDMGEDYLKQLLSCSFFDKWGNNVIMHDLMHDLAEAVSGDFFARLEHGDQATRISERARYFSFSRDSFERLSRFEGLFEAKYLTTFVPLRSRSPICYLSNEIPATLIPQFYCLHVLSLTEYRVLELPDSIGNLKQLRYLDVSGTRIKELPESVSTLCNLQSLLMSRCDAIERLPTDMSKLVSLRYLDVSGTRIKELPESVGTLCNLQSLLLSRCNALERLPTDISKLVSLRYLDVSDMRIKELPHSVSTLCNLQSLVLSGCINLEQLPAETSRLVSLCHLDISDTRSLKQMPNYMSKLKYLQTLSGFVVGKHCGQGIEELKDLQHIRGKIALRRLQNISSPEVALDANLSCKEHIGELAFEYDDSGDYGSKIIEAVLENLKPHPNLEKLTIRRYPGTQFPNWLDTQCLMYENIVNLTLEGCKNCYRLPALGQLPSLKYLRIVGMENIEVIGSEFYGCDSGLVNPFPVLQNLVIRDMEYWKEWSGYEMEDRVPFPCLEELELGNCPELKGDLPANVKVLKIRGCKSLESSQGSHVSASQHRALRISFHLSSITRLELEGVKELVSLPSEVGLLSCLETLRLQGCEKLVSLRNVRLPTKLGSLGIRECKILESLPQEMELLNNLRELELWSCPCVKSAPKDTLPTSLQSLYVEGCERWEFPIPIEVEKMQCYSALQKLFINGSGGVSFPLGGFPNLRSFGIWNLQELERVYIPTGVDLTKLTSLQHLSIIGCPKLRWIGKTEEEGVVDLPAPNLQGLDIIRCELVKPLLMLSGDREGLPLKLQTLDIDINNFNTVTSSHRKCQNLLKFTCLRELTLGRHMGEDFPDKGCSLPVSITELFLYDCPNLKRLNGEALKTLTSLQQLRISKCPNVECLPEEGLPPSLGGLYIRECPKLEERCKRDTGLDWPIIQHLPCVRIIGKLI